MLIMLFIVLCRKLSRELKQPFVDDFIRIGVAFFKWDFIDETFNLASLQ